MNVLQKPLNPYAVAAIVVALAAITLPAYWAVGLATMAIMAGLGHALVAATQHHWDKATRGGR